VLKWINGRSIFLFVCIGTSVAAAFYGQPLAHENTDAITIIITVMTVFAGFLVAIIAILGDPAMMPAGSWRAAENSHPAIYGRVATYTWLFQLYLIAIAFLFAGALLQKAPDSAVSHVWKVWIERLYVFFGVLSFLLTTALPGALGKLQLRRAEAEIERRRQDAGIQG
jgi:hypothetical protein